jgi:hypothetical protein
MAAKITKIQNYAILWLHSQGHEPESISKELAVEIKSVNRVLEKKAKINEKNNIKTKTEVAIKPSSKDLMIRHTSSKKTNSVAIMTKEASEINDHAKKNNPVNSRNQKHIFRPNG